jgi:hypothetical protein
MSEDQPIDFNDAFFLNFDKHHEELERMANLSRIELEVYARKCQDSIKVPVSHKSQIQRARVTKPDELEEEERLADIQVKLEESLARSMEEPTIEHGSLLNTPNLTRFSAAMICEEALILNESWDLLESSVAAYLRSLIADSIMLATQKQRLQNPLTRRKLINLDDEIVGAAVQLRKPIKLPSAEVCKIIESLDKVQK